MPIKIDFLANVRDFLRGTGDAEDALDEVGDSLDEMADAAKKGGREAERSVEKLEGTFRDAARRARDLGDAGEKAGRDVDRGMKRAEEGVDEFRDEANSTAREAAASFDGSAESIADAFQEVAANAFAGFGPAGALAGLAAAAGIGLAMAGIEDVQEAQTENEKLAAAWADRYVESGQRVASAAQQTAEIIAITGDAERYKEATENAELWGVTVSDAMLAMVGNAGAMQIVEDALGRQRAAASDAASAAQELTEAAGGQLLTLTLEEQQLIKAEGAWARHTDAMRSGGEQADAASESLLRLVEQESAVATAVDDLGNKVVTLPDGTEIFIDVQTGIATANLDKFRGDADGIIDQLNAREIVVQARGAFARAQQDFDQFVSRNNGTEIWVRGRMKVDSGGWDGQG